MSEAYGLPLNAKSLVGSVMANLCGSDYTLHMAMVEMFSQRVLIDKAFSVPKCVRLARMSHHSHRLLRKVRGTVPKEQRDDLCEIWGEELLGLESENTSDLERQNVMGKPMAEIGPDAFKRPLLTHRNAITTGWKRVGRVSRDNTRVRELILEEDLAKNVPGEKLCEIEAAAKSYAKRVRQTPSDRGIEKSRKYLKDNGLLAVPFDKGVGFCVMKKTTNEAKRTELLQSEQLSEKPGLTDSVVMKIEKEINKELLAMKKKDEIDEAVYSRLRSTGGQPARLYGLAKVHKKGTPLRTVLSLPGSSYEHLNKTLAKFFDNIEGANIETNTQMAREIIENIDLDYNESIISLDVKSLYTNVPLKEAIDIALRKLYEQTSPPKLARGTMKKLLNMARCKEQRDQEKPTENVKAFLRYVDDIVRTVKGDPDIVLKAANELHPNLQFTIENPDSNGDLAFLDLNINVDSRKKKYINMGKL
ncbi:uncharacterized protein LOC134855525 [Symsagittifera roscoffensis]|uniref:uncharacterized protein LOC134855525 n=1 Tax=Symsagittifera roscoffensis TaxID=84072 RepID=UPI00307B1D82